MSDQEQWESKEFGMVGCLVTWIVFLIKKEDSWPSTWYFKGNQDRKLLGHNIGMKEKSNMQRKDYGIKEKELVEMLI